MAIQKRSHTALTNKDVEKKRLPEEYFVEKGLAVNREPDTRIQEEVWSFLKNFPGLDLSEVEIDVRNGLVTVMGTFPDGQTQGRVVHHISNLQGVKHVTDKSRILVKHTLINAAHENDET